MMALISQAMERELADLDAKGSQARSPPITV